MKNITTTIKTMLFAVVVLVLEQGCIPNNQQPVNPIPSMSGKIKNIKNIAKLGKLFYESVFYLFVNYLCTS